VERQAQHLRLDKVAHLLEHPAVAEAALVAVEAADVVVVAELPQYQLARLFVGPMVSRT
jgi:hypothetical protein